MCQVIIIMFISIFDVFSNFNLLKHSVIERLPVIQLDREPWEIAFEEVKEELDYYRHKVIVITACVDNANWCSHDDCIVIALPS